MILFIRDGLDRTILDVEVYADEHGNTNITSKIMIKPYSEFLVNNLEDDLKIIRDFSQLQEIGNNYNINISTQDAVDQLRGVLRQVANEYELAYVED